MSKTIFSRPSLLSISMPVEAVPSFTRAFKQRTGAEPIEFHRFEAFEPGPEDDDDGEALAHSWLAGRLLCGSVVPRLVALEICCAAVPLGWFAPHEGRGLYNFLESRTYSLEEAMRLAAQERDQRKASIATVREMVARMRPSL